MRATNQMRRLLVELRRRWSDTIDDRLLLQCTLDEIEAAAHGAGFPTDGELERRAAQFAEAVDTEVSEWSDGSLGLLLDDRTGDRPSDDDELAGHCGIVRRRRAGRGPASSPTPTETSTTATSSSPP